MNMVSYKSDVMIGSNFPENITSSCENNQDFERHIFPLRERAWTQ